MNKNIKKLIATTALTIASMSAAHADVLYSLSFAGAPNAPAWCTTCNNSYQVYEGFTLGADSTVSSVSFTVNALYGSNWNPTVTIKSNDFATTYFQQNFPFSSYGLTTTGLGYDILSANVGALFLAAGDYQLGFSDAHAMAAADWTGGPGRLTQIGNSGAYGDVAIQVNGSSDVPEPASLALIGLSLFGLAGARRKRA